jgi:hypothetical protein
MTASLSDILTTQKNGVVAINGLNQTLKLIEADLPCICTNLAGILVQLEQIAINTALAIPSLMSPTVPAANAGTQIVVGAGRLFAISIPTHSGSSQIRVYNSATTGGISATNLIFQSLPSNTSGWTTYYTVNLAYTNGLVVATDASTTCAVSYTPNP